MSEWYNNYLQSEHWEGLKQKTKSKNSSFRRRGCLVCGCKSFDIHHLDYRYINKEKLNKHLTPLCREHHYQFHDWQKQFNKLEGDVGLWIETFYPHVWQNLHHVQKHKTNKYSSESKIKKINKQMRIIDKFRDYLQSNCPDCEVRFSKRAVGALAPHTNKILDYFGFIGNDRRERLLAMKTQVFDKYELIPKLKEFRAVLDDYYGVKSL